MIEGHSIDGLVDDENPPGDNDDGRSHVFRTLQRK